jgi:hypothetical protein
MGKFFMVPEFLAKIHFFRYIGGNGGYKGEGKLLHVSAGEWEKKKPAREGPASGWQHLL